MGSSLSLKGMDQFKKLYTPILKPIRPGEKRSPHPNVASPSSARFEFSKKFAAMLTQELAVENRDDSHSTKGPESFSETEEPIAFKPSQAPKLNLTRAGLLGRPTEVNISPSPNKETGNQADHRDPAPERPSENPVNPPPSSSQLDWSALDSDPLIIEQEEDKGGLDDELEGEELKSEKFNVLGMAPTEMWDKAESDKTVRLNNRVIPDFKRSEVESAMESCRAMFLEVETGLGKLENDLPCCIALLDDKLGIGLILPDHAVY